MADSSAKKVIAKYFDAVAQKADWQSLISDDMAFTMPAQTTRGKASYVEITERFLRAVTGVKIRQTIVDGDSACVIAAYDLRSPKGNTSTKDVVEILSVKGEKIASSSIYFDTEDFKTFMAR
jgi:ketosteroid isomerase-like protein